MIVLDASLAIELLLETPRVAPLTEALFGAQEDLHAPHLIDIEVLQALRRLNARNELTDRRAEEAIRDLADLPLVRHSHEHNIPAPPLFATIERAVRENDRKSRGEKRRRVLSEAS